MSEEELQEEELQEEEGPKKRAKRRIEHHRKKIEVAKRLKEFEGDELQAEVGITIGTATGFNPWVAWTHLSVKEAKRMAKRRYLLKRNDVLTNRFVKHEEAMDLDKDMAGPVAIERTLLFLRNICTRLPSRLGITDICVFLLVTGPLAISATEAAMLMNTHHNNVLRSIDKMIDKKYIEVYIQGGRKGARLKGKVTGSQYTRTRRGKALFDDVLCMFDTRKFGALADIMDKNVKSLPLPQLIKARERQVDLSKDIDLSKI